MSEVSEAQVEQVFPGPCPPTGCPPTTEIDCLGVNKIYDFCFQQDTAAAPCVTIPGTPTVPTGSTSTCAITAITCAAGTPTPTGVDGLATVSIVVTITYTITVISPTGTTIVTIPANTFVFTKTAIVCAPVGTSADCTATASCACTVIPGPGGLAGVVCCSFFLCILIETFAPVKVLVPTYGFCTPAACRTGGFPPCPPFPLFPPQECGF